ncbi:MAG: hypothetical protein AB1595_01450 [bacterium]
MSFLELLGLYVTAAGTLASVLGVVLGIFFAVYTKQNGKITREFIAAENKNMKEFIAKVLDRIDQRAEERHREAMVKLG